MFAARILIRHRIVCSAISRQSITESERMTHVAVTGARGFLGWHTRSALVSAGHEIRAISVGEGFNQEEAHRALEGSSRLIHIAGVNRGSDREVGEGNLVFARQMALALARTAAPPRVIVNANSTQIGNGSVYGEAKKRASEVLRAAAESVGAEYVDVHLPNLFGEHGRPFYNSVVATFCHLLASGEQPSVDQDKELQLLHAQDAADLLTGVSPGGDGGASPVLVSDILRRLAVIAQLYSGGEIPDVASALDRNLFNTYRSFTILASARIELQRRSDVRGSFFEIVRAHGGQGQSSFSTTAPGISRGDHFHRRKIERFAVLSGRAVISMRRLFTNEILEFSVSGAAPAAIDMPTMWAHKITNTGSDELSTSFWSNEIFDPESPDTFAEAV